MPMEKLLSGYGTSALSPSAVSLYGESSMPDALTASAAYRMMGGDKGGGHGNHDEHERSDSRSDEEPSV